jgi:glutaredoxin
MKDIILYSTHCPKCNILKQKLDAKNIRYTENNNIQQMKTLGILTVPILAIEGELLDFSKAIEWINQQEEQN